MGQAAFVRQSTFNLHCHQARKRDELEAEIEARRKLGTGEAPGGKRSGGGREGGGPGRKLDILRRAGGQDGMVGERAQKAWFGRLLAFQRKAGGKTGAPFAF